MFIIILIIIIIIIIIIITIIIISLLWPQFNLAYKLIPSSAWRDSPQSWKRLQQCLSRLPSV